MYLSSLRRRILKDHIFEPYRTQSFSLLKNNESKQAINAPNWKKWLQ